MPPIATVLLGFLFAFTPVRFLLWRRQAGATAVVVLLAAASSGCIFGAAIPMASHCWAAGGVGFGLGACTACLFRRQHGSSAPRPTSASRLEPG